MLGHHRFHEPLLFEKRHFQFRNQNAIDVNLMKSISEAKAWQSGSAQWRQAATHAYLSY
jgi:hypothetical protein